MSRVSWLLGVVVLTAMFSGCRCAPGFQQYADFIDDVNDNPVLWDQWYCPRLDISRAGKPDWCGPVNSRLAPCRCEGTGCWDRADECWRYPQGYPYWYPARTLDLTTHVGPAIEHPPSPAPAAPPASQPPYEEAPAPQLPPAPPPGAPPLPLP